VRWVVQKQHRFSHNVEEREEGGTPNILGIIRAAVPMQVRTSWLQSLQHTCSMSCEVQCEFWLNCVHGRCRCAHSVQEQQCSNLKCAADPSHARPRCHA
jgi:selenocysteine lyase/cysteine desulfurase